jgi:hypothetical protein
MPDDLYDCKIGRKKWSRHNRREPLLIVSDFDCLKNVILLILKAFYRLLHTPKKNRHKTQHSQNLRKDFGNAVFVIFASTLLKADNQSPYLWLCVCASGLITVIFSFLTSIMLSCLHFGQYSGKFSSTVSASIINRVLCPQAGHNIQSFFFNTIAPPNTL